MGTAKTALAMMHRIDRSECSPGTYGGFVVTRRQRYSLGGCTVAYRTQGVSTLSGIYYLNYSDWYYAECHITWRGDPLSSAYNRRLMRLIGLW